MIIRKKSHWQSLRSGARLWSSRSAAYQTIRDEIHGFCGEAQTQQIIETIRRARKGVPAVDTLSVCALGETVQHLRGQLRQAVQVVRQVRSGDRVVDFCSAAAEERLSALQVAYKRAQQAYVIHHRAAMRAAQRRSW